MRWDFFRRSEPDDLAARSGSAARDERLSEYLEGSLSAEERRAVEGDLGRDAALRTMLEGMALVRDGMHELGMMRSPRSFTITASRRPRSTSLPRLELGMRIATGAASIALVAAFVGPTYLGGSSVDEVTSGEPVIVQARAASGSEVASDAAATAGTVESFAASTVAPADAAAAGATGPVGGGIESAAPAPATGAEAAATPESAAAALAPSTDGAGGAAPANTPLAEGGTPLPAENAPPAAEGTSLAQGTAPPAEEGSGTVLKGPPGEGAASAVGDDSAGIDWVLWSRAGAAAAAVALAIGSVGLWWQRRRSGR